MDKKLYLVTDSTDLDQEIFLGKVEEAARAGVSMIQLREKECTGREYLELGRKVKTICDEYDIPLLIDDRVDIAQILGCGVHLGQTDIPIADARRILGPKAIIGATAKTVEQATQAEREGASYLGVGAIFPTTTKVITILTEVSTLRDICNAVAIPVYAIGGLNIENIHVLKGVPISGICVVSAIMKAKNSYAAATELREKIQTL